MRQYLMGRPKRVFDELIEINSRLFLKFGFKDLYPARLPTRHGTFYHKNILIGPYINNLKVAHGFTRGTITPRHLFAFDDPGRIGATPYRTGYTDAVATMCFPPAAKTVPFDHT